ncbi:MAG: RNA polymerase sigma factor, partial [Clostridiales bacterium]|nr:RNA polymerase sigma factor [Clostridiales bacterium]
MAKSLLRTDREIAELYERHKKTVYRVCFAYMKNAADTEDAVQDAF